MKTPIVLIITIITVTFTTSLPYTSNAAEMGGQLRLSDNKEELNDVMNQIHKITDHKYRATSNNTTFDIIQKIEFSGCKIRKYSDETRLGDGHKCFSEYELKLSDIDSSKLIIINSNPYVELTVRDFGKKISMKRCFEADPYVDKIRLAVSPGNSELLLDLFKKSIKLCADK